MMHISKYHRNYSMNVPCVISWRTTVIVRSILQVWCVWVPPSPVAVQDQHQGGADVLQEEERQWCLGDCVHHGGRTAQESGTIKGLWGMQDECEYIIWGTKPFAEPVGKHSVHFTTACINVSSVHHYSYIQYKSVKVTCLYVCAYKITMSLCVDYVCSKSSYFLLKK